MAEYSSPALYRWPAPWHHLFERIELPVSAEPRSTAVSRPFRASAVSWGPFYGRNPRRCIGTGSHMAQTPPMPSTPRRQQTGSERVSIGCSVSGVITVGSVSSASGFSNIISVAVSAASAVSALYPVSAVPALLPRGEVPHHLTRRSRSRHRRCSGRSRAIDTSALRA